MKRISSAFIGVVIMAVSARADSTSYTPAGGYFTLNIQGQSDNQVALPIYQKVASFGKVSTVSSDKVTVHAKTWNAGDFRVSADTKPGTYYAEFASGALKGVRYRVLDNSEDTLLLDTEGDDLTAHPSGAVAFDDVVWLRPMWTLSNVFGATETDVVLQPKANPLLPGDSVLTVAPLSVGQNKAPTGEYSFVRGMGWRATGDLDTDQAHRPFQVGEPMVVRRINSQSVSVVLLGYVLAGQQSMYVPGGDGTNGNDAYVSVIFPEAVSLDASGLYNTGTPAAGVIHGTGNPLLRADELLGFGTGIGFNLAPERSFFYLNGAGWREVGSDSTSVGSDFLLEPGKPYIIRKKKGNGGVDWIQQAGGH